jgi:hypothetical protein
VRARVLLILSGSMLLALRPAHAQAGQDRTRLGGLTFDHWRGASSPAALLRPTLRLTTYAGGGPGADFALVFFPDGISIMPPILRLGFQAGLVQPVSAGPATLLLKAGGAGIATAGILSDLRFLHLIPGVQAGVGLLIPVDRKSTLRLDITRHWYRTGSYGVSVWSFGFGFAGGLRRPQ